MDTFLGTLVFLLPGLMLYFWLQSFGINPVVKHNPAEFSAVAVLLWFPVSLSAILVFNLFVTVANAISSFEPIWTTEGLKTASGDFLFLILFLGSSLVISFLFGLVWAKWIHQQLFMRIINKVRKSRGIAPLSRTPSVWDEVFLNNDVQVVEIGKIDKSSEPGYIGEIKKASRTFEPERNIYLNEIQFFTELVEKHSIPVVNIFFDTKSGMYVKIFDAEEIKNAQLKDIEQLNKGEDTTSS
ncbi:DUF6338 family protein [Niallia taxi]|uniref:Uncharacterized protein n=1 Tax=Niallia taxi TaxID=2499688 RepID=A0A3S2TWY1_9BACI|nr:DUF6338 family protein [Niallia taxi]RVT67690.1 hypothetical protein EM808_04230 [Niallia taxi]